MASLLSGKGLSIKPSLVIRGTAAGILTGPARCAQLAPGPLGGGAGAVPKAVESLAVQVGRQPVAQLQAADQRQSPFLGHARGGAFEQVGLFPRAAPAGRLPRPGSAHRWLCLRPCVALECPPTDGPLCTCRVEKNQPRRFNSPIAVARDAGQFAGSGWFDLHNRAISSTAC
jgi:hypothetical protein